MKQLLRNRNLWVIGGIALAVLLLLVFGRGSLRTELPRVMPPVESATAEPEAVAYVLVTAGEEKQTYPVWETARAVTVRQAQSDGTEWENEITMGAEGVWMSHANCDNQDCVGQGRITLENRETRILTNMIICLPHKVVVELYTPEEYQAMSGANGHE